MEAKALLVLAKCSFYPQLLLFATVRSLTSHRWVSRLFTETAGSDGSERSVSLTQAVNILTTVGRQVNPHYGAAIFQVCINVRQRASNHYVDLFCDKMWLIETLL